FAFMLCPPSRSTLFPYTTLFRSGLAFLPSILGVKLRITVKEKDEETALNKLSEIEQKIISKAGRYIYSREEEALEAVVGKILKRSEEHTSELQSRENLVCRLLLE